MLQVVIHCTALLCLLPCIFKPLVQEERYELTNSEYIYLYLFFNNLMQTIGCNRKAEMQYHYVTGSTSWFFIGTGGSWKSLCII
jgi:hypothetical protein